MVTFKDRYELKKYVLEMVEENDFGIISIDGIDGSGKSNLASYIIQDTNFYHIDLDDDRYLTKEMGKKVDFIKYQILEKDISQYLSKNRKIFVDSVCVLKILNRIDIIPNIKIYVKKLLDWLEGDKFDYSKDVEEVIRDDLESLKKIIEMGAHIEGEEPESFEVTESLSHEIIRYHYEYQPDKNAEIIFERAENAG